MSEDIDKAESHKRLPVPTTEIGQTGIVTSSFFVQDSRKTELAMPTRFATFDRMMEDDAVFNSVDLTNLHTVSAMYNGEFRSNTAKGKIAADFLNYNIRNMGYGTWLDACMDAATDLRYGFSLQNIVMKKRNYGPYKGQRVLHKLAPRDQKSLYGWVWDDNFREVLGVVQKPSFKQDKLARSRFSQDGLNQLQAVRMQDQNYSYIPSQKLLHYRHGSVNGNPQGDSPLMHCYDAWMEKKLVENYEIVGVSKDLG